MSLTPGDFTKAREFLDTLYPPHVLPESRAFLTLTFAQSLDGKIAKHGEQVLLSAKESLAMTHRLRILHDAILVGVRTVAIDDPQLNARHLSKADLDHAVQPQPVILDPCLELSSNCKLLRNYREKDGKQPWVFAKKNQSEERKKVLEESGAKVFELDVERHDTIGAILHALREKGIKTVMVEGGARVIQSCLLSGLVDQVIITIAPKWVGPGIDATYAPGSLANVKYEQFGADMVVAAQLGTHGTGNTQ